MLGQICKIIYDHCVAVIARGKDISQEERKTAPLTYSSAGDFLTSLGPNSPTICISCLFTLKHGLVDLRKVYFVNFLVVPLLIRGNLP